MKLKRLTAVMLTVVMLFTMLSCGLNALAVVMCETQYVYDSANMSWLKDLIVKENMSSVGGLSQRNTIVAKAEYPYRATPQSFSEEIAYYQAIYTLDEDMANVIYLYMLEMVKSFTSANTKNYSDEFIKAYLEKIGIVYPQNSANDDETKIVARALFSIITADEKFKVEPRTGLYEAFMDYASKLIGVDINALLRFDADSDISDLKQYAVAMCKYLLHNMGYKIDKDTEDAEVFRLIAISTIKAQGISIDSSTATFEEIKNKYLCAMMCDMYGVSIDTAGFAKAVEMNGLSFYMLQLIGKESGITVKDTLTYNEAFNLVCEKTDFFDLEEGEFYADIYEYDIKLNYKRSTIWLYPQTLGTTNTDEGTVVDVKINGNDVRENYYVDVAIDKDKDVVPVVVTVEYTEKSGKKISSSYKLNIYQGAAEPATGSTISDALSGVKDVVENLLGEVGSDSSIADLVANIPFELPTRILGLASLFVPAFDGLSQGIGYITQLFGYSKDNDSNVDKDDIGGVGGLDAFNPDSDSSQSMDFGSVNIGNLQIKPNPNNTPVFQPADSIVIPNQPTEQEPVVRDGNWFDELMNDSGAVIIIVLILVLTFGICLTLFLLILNSRTAKKNKKESN